MAEIHSQPTNRPSNVGRAMCQALRDALGCCVEHPAAAAADDAPAIISPERHPTTWRAWPEPAAAADVEAPWCPEYTGLYVTNHW